MRKGARTLIAIMRSKSSSGVWSVEAVPMMPAAFTSTSRPPKRATASPTTRAGVSLAVTSAATTAAGPAASAATAASAPWSRLTSTTEAPSRAKPSAEARPIPELAPVTTTTFPANIPWLVMAEEYRARPRLS
jgi:hypothetical protein